MNLEEKLRRGRHLARTDAFYLATEILGFDKLRPEVHGPVCDFLVQFGDYQGQDNIQVRGKSVVCTYTPLDPDPANVLPRHPRRRLLLDARGWFKTTTNIVTHTIQTVLNFPDISMLLVHANTTIVQQMLGQIKRQFLFNNKMRLLFPEFCFKNANDAGTKSEFIIPARTDPRVSSPTVSIASIESITAGMHYQWIKFTDIVDQNNSRTPEQRAKIRETFWQYFNLLISQRYFVDVEGTCYHYGDVYNAEIIEKQIKLPPEERNWKMFVRGCFKKQTPNNEPELFNPEERNLDYAYDKKNKRISNFPQHESTDDLEAQKQDNEFLFATQKLNNPVAADIENRPFPINKMSWTPRTQLQHIAFYRYTMTVDTAEKISTRADFTAITIVGWDRQGRGYLVDAVQGKFLPEKVVDWIFDLYKKWKCFELRIEESSFNRGLYPLIRRREDLELEKPLNLQFVKRYSYEAKNERILALQPFFHNGDLRFSADLSDYIKEQLKKQFSEFPMGEHDDLIDALADQFANRDWMGVEAPRQDSIKEIMENRFKERLQEHSLAETIFGPYEPVSSWDGLGSL